jgi:hypothetical protein
LSTLADGRDVFLLEETSGAKIRTVIDPEDPEYLEKWVARFEEELIGGPEELKEWISVNCGSYEKLHALMYIYGEMDDIHTFRLLLGYFWTCCDNIGVYRDELANLLSDGVDGPYTQVPELMDEKELAALDLLPEQITIYRGCGPVNKNGLSWSQDLEVAMRFPLLARFHSDQPILLTATIKKKRIAALKLDRGEQELIVVDLPESCWTEEPIIDLPPRKLCESTAQ